MMFCLPIRAFLFQRLPFGIVAGCFFVFGLPLILPLKAEGTPGAAGVMASCQNLLEGSVTQGLEIPLREEIMVLQQKDRLSGRPMAGVSNFLENRVTLPIDTSVSPGGHIVSLGSGADIFLPLYLYPQAQYYHLVDHLEGWGAGPNDVIFEIESRLQSLAGDGLVKKTELPYLRGAGSLVWELQWPTKHHGLQKKVFILHALDFNERAAIDSIFHLPWPLSPSQGWRGVVVTGVSLDLNLRRLFLNRLEPRGGMYTEMIYVNKDGLTTTPDDVEDLKALDKEYDVTDLGLVEEDFAFKPRVFYIRSLIRNSLSPLDEILTQEIVGVLSNTAKDFSERQTELLTHQLELEMIYGVDEAKRIMGLAIEQWRRNHRWRVSKNLRNDPKF